MSRAMSPSTGAGWASARPAPGPDRLAERYQALRTSPDPLEREVAHRQLAALERARRVPQVPTTTDDDQSAGSDLVARVEAAAGPLRVRPNGDREGPCPWHTSRAGRCLVVFGSGARWWCRDCGRGGDIAAWVAALEGIGYRAARRRLGLPIERRAVRRPTLSVEVAL